MIFTWLHRKLGLKWKLLIPFLFLASMGATALFLVSYHFQAALIHQNESRRLANKYQYFLSVIDYKKQLVLSLALAVAKSPEVAEAFAGRDRQRLLEMLRPTYETLNRDYGITQLHFHLPPSTSFLRVHLPDRYGDDLGYRQTIKRARETGQPVGGLEWGPTGFSVRGVVPVFQGDRQIGTVEVGAGFGIVMLEQFKKDYESEVTVCWLGEPPRDVPVALASTLKDCSLPPWVLGRVLETQGIVFDSAALEDRSTASISGPIRDFSGQIAAVVRISVDRSSTLALLKRYGAIAVAVGLIGLALSISFVWFISVAFTRRIEKVVKAAGDIAAGQRDTRIEMESADEMGIMARAINEMLRSLEASREKIKDYAQNLEVMVEQRTAALRESEQTYRTLVEHVPVIVYLVMQDTTAIFMNRFVEQVLGVAPHILNGPLENWQKYIHPADQARVVESFRQCMEGAMEFHAEYRMVHRDGRVIHVVDHAVPVSSADGQLVRMDGIIIDVTARVELQDKIVQAEELQTLSQISARLAHEIRNPLTSVGGLARRLVKGFSLSDPRSKKAELIMQEVKKLERILAMMTAYIEPKSISLSPCDVNHLAMKAIGEIRRKLATDAFVVRSSLEDGLGVVSLDCELIEKALVSLMQNAYYRMKQQGELELTTGRQGDRVTVTLTYRVAFISDDDIEHFFYPFVVDYPFPEHGVDEAIMDVPICRILIHKHGGMVHVSKEDNNLIKIVISLPHEPPSEE